MRPKRPLGGALFWVAVGFLAAGLLTVAYFSFATPSVRLSDHELDDLARRDQIK